MRPVHTASSNLVYKGPTPAVADLHCQRVAPGHVLSVWRPSPEERELIARGANIELQVLTEPHPVVALNVTDEVGIGEDAPEVLDRLDRLRSDRPPSPPPPPRDREVG